MSLNDILKKISDEAAKKAALIKQVSDDEITKVHEEAALAAEARKVEIEQKVIYQSASMIEKSKTLASMEGRSTTLREKRAIIDEAFSEVEKELNSLDSGDYTDLLVTMIKRVMQSVEKGSLIVPEVRRKETEVALEKANADFHIKSDTNDFKGGFILSSGKIEINLSFPYLIQKIVRPATELDVAKVLFP